MHAPGGIIASLYSRRDWIRLTSAATAAFCGGIRAEAGHLEPIASHPDFWKPGGLCLNEDSSHYFYTRAGRILYSSTVEHWVDQYAGTQVRELMLNPNCMRVSYRSRVWDPIWRGYDPNGPDDQPLLASRPPAERPIARRWIHTAWQLDQAGIDPYRRWIARARRCGISPWISMRMNDVHYTEDEKAFIHSEFWRDHPEYRRVPYRFATATDRAFDYARPEVRAYHMALIRELVERYDLDGLELDWMRFSHHFQPGHEAAGRDILTRFMGETRQLLNRWESRRRHRIRLGVRVPSRPQTARGLGLDAAVWCRKGWVDMLVVTPFFMSVEPDMPLDEWRGLLRGTHTLLAAGLELHLQPYPGFPSHPTNSIETTRGAAAALLQRGADRVYLFNYMDSDTAIEDLDHYPPLLRECGRLATLKGKPRRHVITYADLWAPGEPSARALPVNTFPGSWHAFRLPTGPRPQGGLARVRLGLERVSADAAKTWDLRLNGASCRFAGPESVAKPIPHVPLIAYDIPEAALLDGDNMVEVGGQHEGRLVWVEIAFDRP